MEGDIAKLKAKSSRNADLLSAPSATNLASSSTIPLPAARPSSPFKSVNQREKEAKLQKQSASQQMVDQEAIEALKASLTELTENSPIRLDSDPRVEEAIVDSLKRWLIGPEQRGRRRERVAGLEAGLQVAAQRANLDATGAVPALRRIAEQAQQHGGEPFLRSMLGWVAKGMLRVITNKGTTKEMLHTENFWLFRFLGITPADNAVKGLSVQCLQAERLAGSPAQAEHFRRMREEIEQHKPELRHHMRDIFGAFARGMQDDDIVRMAREVAPKLVERSDLLIAELRKERMRGSVPQTEPARSTTAGTRDRQLQLPGEQLDIDGELRAKEAELASEQVRREGLRLELAEKARQSAELVAQEAAERAGRQPPTEDATTLKEARDAQAQLWNEVKSNEAVLSVITPSALRFAIDRHVGQSWTDMEGRILRGETGHTATFLSGAMLLRVLAEVASYLSSSAGRTAAAPATHHLELPMNFQVGDGLVRLSTGGTERRKAWGVSIKVDEDNRASHIFPEVRTLSDRLPASQQRTLHQSN